MLPMIHLAAKIVAGGEMVNRRSVLKIGVATMTVGLVKMPAFWPEPVANRRPPVSQSDF